MWVNGFTFFICAWALSFLPKIEDKLHEEHLHITLKIIRQDFIKVWAFIKKKPNLLLFFIIYTLSLMIAFSLQLSALILIATLLILLPQHRQHSPNHRQQFFPEAESLNGRQIVLHLPG